MNKLTSLDHWLIELKFLPGNSSLKADVHQRLIASYSEAVRAYHNLSHIESMLAHGVKWRQHFTNWPAVFFAIWFHDAVYVPGKGDNEARSADMAQRDLVRLGVEPALIKRVVALILATKDHHIECHDAEGRLFLDLDMAILGAPVEVYGAYCQGVREEFRSIPRVIFNGGRRKFLKQQLALDFIFAHPLGRDTWEIKARDNIAKELAAMKWWR